MIAAVCYAVLPRRWPLLSVLHHLLRRPILHDDHYGAAGAVIADLRISVARIPYRTWVSRFVATQMDVDRNGQLDSKELSLVTEKREAAWNISGPKEILASAVADPEAAEVPTKRFTEWLQTRLPKSFDLIAQPQAADDAVRLTSLIDVNLDASFLMRASAVSANPAVSRSRQ